MPLPQASYFQVVRQSIPFSWTWYLRNAFRGFLQIWHKHPFWHVVIWIWWWKVKGHGHCEISQLPHWCECDISGTSAGGFHTCGKNLELDSKMKWQKFGGQRSKVSVFSQNMLLAITHTFIHKFSRNFTQMSDRIKWQSDIILHTEGQRSTTYSHILQKHFSCHLFNVIIQEQKQRLWSNIHIWSSV